MTAQRVAVTVCKTEVVSVGLERVRSLLICGFNDQTRRFERECFDVIRLRTVRLKVEGGVQQCSSAYKYFRTVSRQAALPQSGRYKMSSTTSTSEGRRTAMYG
ncbi:hypothetical protein VTK26DRAFT_5576 [Humicola hyalothermophila]